jgi:aspartate/methionine/tyrosine aminotransferase
VRFAQAAFVVPSRIRAIADQVRGRHGVEVDPAGGVVVTSGGMVALPLACQANVGPGNAFVPGGEGHIRLCFALEEAILIAAPDRLEAGWAEYQRMGKSGSDRSGDTDRG